MGLCADPAQQTALAGATDWTAALQPWVFIGVVLLLLALPFMGLRRLQATRTERLLQQLPTG